MEMPVITGMLEDDKTHPEEPNLYELIEQLMIEKQELHDKVKALHDENCLLKKELERRKSTGK